MATVKSFKADVSSVSPSWERMTNSVANLRIYLPCYALPLMQHHIFLLFFFFFNLALHSFEIPIVHAFTGDLSESRQSTVTLQELDEGAMEAIVDFFYSGEIDISENNVQELLPVACLLQVQSVQKACCDFLERQLSTENCLGEFLHKSIISDMENILLALKKLAWASLSCRFVGMIETFCKHVGFMLNVEIFNLVHPHIRMHILHTVLNTFPKRLTRRIYLTIKSCFSW